jgi:murein DD-endopeptidase MepM/ murein hydrolase activator NlpD
MNSQQHPISSSALIARPLWQQHTRLLLVLAGSALTLLTLMLVFSQMGSNEFVLAETPVPLEVASTVQPDSAETTGTPGRPLNKLSITLRARETLASVFKRLNIDHAELHSMITAHPRNKILTHVHAGDRIQVLYDDQHAVHELSYRPNLTTQLTIRRATEGFDSNLTSVQLDQRQAYTHAVIKNSLFASGKRQQIAGHILKELVEIFQWDVDFAKDIRSGDSFSILYDESYLDGQKVATGHIAAAEFTNQGRSYRAIRFIDPQGHVDFYTPKGMSMKKQFARTPVKFTRISSTFSLGRWHPILHRLRKHKGVDYAAPSGTPIKATASGQIAFKGRKGGYGNVVVIQHGREYSTLYGHMSGFAQGLQVGSHIRQGQLIGYVGMSGLATGPHLHYEFLVNGIHRDPLTVKLPKGNPVPYAYRNQFRAHVNRMLAHMQTHQQVEFASVGHRKDDLNA